MLISRDDAQCLHECGIFKSQVLISGCGGQPNSVGNACEFEGLYRTPLSNNSKDVNPVLVAGVLLGIIGCPVEALSLPSYGNSIKIICVCVCM